MKITNNKLLYIIESEIKLRQEARALNMVKGMNDDELLSYRKRVLEEINGEQVSL